MSQEASAPLMIEGNTVGAVPPGEMLRAARERAGLTQEDIAGKLKLAARQIAAIETGDWASLPERTFTRGFMRSYARLVGLDPTSLGLELPTSQSVPAAEIKASAETMNEVTFDPSGKSRSSARWLVPALLVAALVAGVVYFQGGYIASMLPTKFGGATPPPTIKTAVAAQAEQAAATKQAEAAGVASAATSSGSVIGAPAATAPATTPGGSTDAADAGKAAASGAMPPSSAGIVSPPVANPDTAAPPAATAVTAPLLGERRVSLTFRGKSWTEVRSKGEVIFSENAQPGTREFSGALPLSFAVGNASNVTLLIDGKPYDMANVTRNDVARFRIE